MIRYLPEMIFLRIYIRIIFMKETDEMAGIKAEKLSAESLEHVAGGTNAEMLRLQKELDVTSLGGITRALKEKGIKAKLSTKNNNEYYDTKTGDPLTHEEVLKRI